MSKNNKRKKKAAVYKYKKAAASKGNQKPVEHSITPKDNVAQTEQTTEQKISAEHEVSTITAEVNAKQIGKVALFIKNNRLATILIFVFLALVGIGTALGIVLGTRYELVSIEVGSLPTKTEYIENQTLDTDGLIIKANYSNKKSVVIDDYDIAQQVLKLGDNLITITYKESGITKTTMFSVKAVKRSLVNLKIGSMPSKTSYYENESFDPIGITVTAFYNNGESAIITDYTYDKVDPLQTSDKTVKISYTEDGITLTAEIEITVIAKALLSIEITTPPTKTSYLEGTTFDPTGIIVKAYFDNNEQEFVDDWDYDNKKPLQVTDSVITVSYGGKSATVEISVNPKILISIMASSLPQKIQYVEGEYFDFLGIAIHADYENASSELITGWDYDKKQPLTTDDKSVLITYTLHDITKTLSLTIVVQKAPPVVPPEQKLLNDVLGLLPPIANLTENDLNSLDYALSLLKSASNLTPEQKTLKSELETKRQDIVDNLPPVIENEYEITYAIADGLIFDDICYGNNPTSHKNSSGKVVLAPATSAIATEQGYQFAYWTMEGRPIESLDNLSTNITVYAVFALSKTVNIVYKDYSTGSELLRCENVVRSSEYNFEKEGIQSKIYSDKKVLAVGFYDSNKIRISIADLSLGSTITILVKTSAARELHLPDADSADNANSAYSVTVAWEYSYNDDAGTQQVSKTPSVGIAFVVPLGATVTLVSLHANIKDILIDGKKKGEQLNSTTVKAVFVLAEGEYPASVTFETAIKDITTISFVGDNQHSFVYPSGWDGLIADIDLDTVAFTYNESSDTYLNIYTIEGNEYCFDDLKSYKFSANTIVIVKKVRNSFSFAIVYKNGTEKIDNLRGKQTLKNALNILQTGALEMVNTIFGDGKLYSDAMLTKEITVDELLQRILRGNITVYSDWERPAPQPPAPPTFEDVDYNLYDFVGSWTSFFNRSGDILSSELVLAADGYYTYKTFVNGTISADISGVYRIESDNIVLKTFILNYEYPLVNAENLIIDIAFVSDGLIRASFIELSNTTFTHFEQTLTCGNVRPVNYTNENFIGEYQSGDAVIDLLVNGTAVITHQGVSTTVYYRVTEDGRLFVFSNSEYGTGEIADLIGDDKNEN